MGSIADIYAVARLVLDTGQFEATAVAAADKTGISAGDKMAKQLQTKINTAVKTVIEGAAGAVLGLAASQGAALDEATQKLAADTGLSGQALADQGNAIDQVYKTSLLSMDSVEQSLAEVISGFGLQGQAADDLTVKFEKYEEATNQTSDAVKSMKDVTDAWNLTAADEGTLMDQLVASHQKYGTVITDMQSALQKIAPAMQAMGMSEKDGVDLLNMFASAGIDASKAALGLQTAVKALKPGQTLNDLIVQISSIQDPLARAQAAGKAFGTRLGSQMADALQPGITSLDQFATSSNDTTDATNKAAQAVEDSWGSRFTLLMHQAGGVLATFGQSFGPLLLVGSQLGPKMASGLGTLGAVLIGKIAEQLGLTLPTWIAGGTTGGTAAGVAASKAEATAITAGTPEVTAAIAGESTDAAAAGGQVGAAVGGALAVGVAAAIPAAIVGAVTWIGDNVVKPIDLELQPNWNMEKPLSEFKKATGEFIGGVAAADKAAADQITSDAAMITQATADGYVGIPTAAEAAMFLANYKIQQGLDNDVKTIQSSKAALTSAWSDAMNTQVSAATIAYRLQSNAADIADNARQIADKKSWKKLTTQQQDALLEQKVQLQANRVALLEEDADYGTKAQKAEKLNGLLQSAALKAGLASTDPDTVAMWQQVEADTQTALDQLQGNMNTGGINAAKALEDGLNGVTVKITSGKFTGKNLGSFDVGTPYVPFDQIAKIHRAERILTADDNAAVSSGAAVLASPAALSAGGDVININIGSYTGSVDQLAAKLAHHIRLTRS